jgi:aspartyl-tRNA(Asn)/glutamyl-tRNA(Gln) amidotransferase subunit B
MRSKEYAHDYRYFPDPDLLPLIVTEEMIQRVREQMPELPSEFRRKYEEELHLFPQDAAALTSSIEHARYFQDVLQELRKIPDIPYGTQHPNIANAKSAANWIANDLSALLNKHNVQIKDSAVTSTKMAGLLAHIFKQTISNKIAKEVMEAMWSGEGTADQIIEKRGLKQISDSGEIEKLVDQAIAAGAKQVEDYRAGKQKALQSLVGQVMKASKGKANPAQVNEILRRKLGG